MVAESAKFGRGRPRAVPPLAPSPWSSFDFALVLVPVVVAIGLAFWFLLQFVQPAPPQSITIATGGRSGGYFAFGRQYAQALARSGISLNVRSTAGSLENVKLLSDPKSGVDLALLQGGVTNTAATPGLRSLGRVFLEPLWVFYRADQTIDRLHQLKGRRIAIGPPGSGTRHLAQTVLAASAIDASNTTLDAASGDVAAKALIAGSIDAVFLAMAPEAMLVRSLMRDPRLKLMSFAQAEALTRLQPYLEHIVLPMGAFDLVQNMPATDVHLVAPVAAVAARENLHPAIAGLMVDALREVHAQGGLFHRFGEYPKAIDPELEVPTDVERYYRSGPSFLKRFLPFWLAIFLERMAILLVPLAGLLFPLFKGVPLLYQWRIRRRLHKWYARLKQIEAADSRDVDGDFIEIHRYQLEDIAAAVSTIRIPLAFSEEYYALRIAIDLVRQRLANRAALNIPNLT